MQQMVHKVINLLLKGMMIDRTGVGRDAGQSNKIRLIRKQGFGVDTVIADRARTA